MLQQHAVIIVHQTSTMLSAKEQYRFSIAKSSVTPIYMTIPEGTQLKENTDKYSVQVSNAYGSNSLKNIKTAALTRKTTLGICHGKAAHILVLL